MLTTYSRNKLYEYFKKRLGFYDYRRGWIKGDCPYCGKPEKFGIHLGFNKSNCFVCETKEKPIDIISYVEGFSIRAEAWNFIKAFEGLEYVEPIVKKPDRKNVNLPESFRLLILGNSIYAKAARAYVKSRGFDPKELSYRGFGYCVSGKYAGYLIMPFYANNQLIYFNARRFMGNGPKYNNPTIEDFGLGKSTIIYNVNALNLYKRIYITEGLFDAITMGDKGISMGGKSLSKYQISTIIKSPVEEVVSLLDPDAYKDAIALGLKLAPFKRFRLVKLPPETDVNDLRFKKTMKYIIKSPWLSFQDLLKLNHSL